jgi:cysteine-rich repeat protein
MSRAGHLGSFGLIALALVHAWPSAAAAQDMCRPESECRFKKPNVLLLLDYSSSMVGFEGGPAYFPRGQNVTTRWDAQLDAVSWILRYDQGFFARNARIGLTRFAHDPETDVPGTVIATDTSFPPITDGFAIDVPFDGSHGDFLECRSTGVEAEVAVLRSSPPPWIQPSLDPTQMMLTWTRGALDAAHTLISDTRANHADDDGEAARDYEVVLMTDGDWTCPDMVGQGCDEDPAPSAAALHDDAVRVHVVAFGDATMQPSLNEVALQGGTAASIDATSPQGIVDALSAVLDQIRDSVIVPECTAGLPRVLVIMDGSSSMIAGSAPGETKWDKARFALAGNPAAPNPGDPGYVEPVLARAIDIDGRQVAIEDVVHLGMVVFAGAEEQRLMVGFGPCMRDNFAWAMDPYTSCQAPGCTDPYAGYPITWTYKDSATDRDPPFVRPTRSYMPACNETPNGASCVGQIANTFTGQGLEFARDVIAQYKADSSPFRAGAATRYVNILISDGETSEGSSDVQSVLQGMVADGIDTYVIGFGTAADLNEAQLNQYAAWGNTGSAIVVDPTVAGGAAPLADALEGVVRAIDVDACCVLDQCSTQPEPSDPGPVCGDGRLEGDEICDDGELNAGYGFCSARCDGPHLFCGDGRTDGPEECDDGNAQGGDGCAVDCTREDDADGGQDFTGSGGVPPITPMMPHAGGAGGSGWVHPMRADAGVDAGAAERAAESDSGCGCRVQRSSGKRAVASTLLAAMLMLVLARRRRRGR